MVSDLSSLCAIDLPRDDTLKELYERLGFDSKLGMVIRNRKNATAASTGDTTR